MIPAAVAPPDDVETLDESSVRPVALNKWALLRKGDQLSFFFQYDQLKLRFQYAQREEFMPKPSWWKRKKIKRDIELLFDDIDEEIYFQEQLSKEMKGKESKRKKILARAETEKASMEEVIAGYDKFTVEEERKIKKMTEEAIKKLTASEKEKATI